MTKQARQNKPVVNEQETTNGKKLLGAMITPVFKRHGHREKESEKESIVQ